MLENLDSRVILYVILVGSTFVLVLSLWLGCVLFWAIRSYSRREILRQRLRTDNAASGPIRLLHLWHDKEEGAVERPDVPRTTIRMRLSRFLRRADMDIAPSSIVLGIVTTVFLALLVSLVVFGSVLPGVGFIAVCFVVGWALLQRRITKQEELFEAQFVDALEVASRSLRAGHPLVGAFRLISEEIPPPVGKIFADICQVQELGLGIDQAIYQVAHSIGNSDVRLFGTSVTIQLRSGGNLADMIERLSSVIRDRIRLSRRIRVLTAQTQFSKRILGAIPIGLFLAINVLNPEYIRPLYATDDGRLMLIVATASVLTGFWVMNRLTVLRY